MGRGEDPRRRLLSRRRPPRGLEHLARAALGRYWPLPPGARPPRRPAPAGGEGRTDRGGARGEAVGPLRDGRARSRRPRPSLRRGTGRAPAQTAPVARAISRGAKLALGVPVYLADRFMAVTAR